MSRTSVSREQSFKYRIYISININNKQATKQISISNVNAMTHYKVIVRCITHHNNSMWWKMTNSFRTFIYQLNAFQSNISHSLIIINTLCTCKRFEVITNNWIMMSDTERYKKYTSLSSLLQRMEWLEFLKNRKRQKARSIQKFNSSSEFNASYY